ncbi:MAG: phosphotriesterase [Dactylosporangium sp.]|nr:hypothetical protein [Dactylosporangium sp.]NNJ60686.1 phosphotriesterase [Dactylosporangium sp.]
MTPVTTVRGPIRPEELGRTLPHEHFQFGYPGCDGDRSMWADDRDAVLASAARAIEAARRAGFTTVIDATPNDCGRDPELLRTIAEVNDLTVVCATGYYYEGEGAPAYFRFRSLFADIVAELAELMERELTVGIRDTGIRAGVIKVGTGEGRITDYERCLLLAAARAQRATGAPIITHTQAGTMGPEQAAILVEAGADPARVVIGHMCGNARDLTYQRATLRYGVAVGFDRVGLNRMFNDITDDDRLEAVTALMDQGYADRILLSHDTVNHWLGRDATGFAELPATRHWNTARIGEYLLPALAGRGCSAADIDRLLVDNVRRLWTA